MGNERSKRLFKWFWPWQDDREEAWLSEMSARGWHLAAMGWPSRYIFVAGEPRRDIYRLDWQDASRKEMSNYVQLFQDAGWEHVGSRSGWQVFRRPDEHGQAPEIFTDVDSKIAKYERMIFAMGGAGAAVVPVMVILMFQDIDAFLGALWGVLLLVALFYIVVLAGLSRRVRQLKQFRRLSTP